MTENDIRKPKTGGLVDATGQAIPDHTLKQLQEEVDKISKDPAIADLAGAVVALWRGYAYVRELISMTGNYSAQARHVFVNKVLQAQLDPSTGSPLPFDSAETVAAIHSLVLPLLNGYVEQEKKARDAMVAELRLMDRRIREKGLLSPFSKLHAADGLLPRGKIVCADVAAGDEGVAALELCRHFVLAGVRVLWVTGQTKEFIEGNAAQLGQHGVLVVSKEHAEAFIVNPASKIRQVPMVDVILLDDLSAGIYDKDHGGYSEFLKHLEKLGQTMVVVSSALPWPGDDNLARASVAVTKDGVRGLFIDGEAAPVVAAADADFNPEPVPVDCRRNAELCRGCDNFKLAILPDLPRCLFDAEDDKMEYDLRAVPVGCPKRAEHAVTVGGMSKNPMYTKGGPRG